MTNMHPDRTDSAQETAPPSNKQTYLGWLTLAYWGALFVATHIPLVQVPLAAAGADKVVHLVAFAGLGFLATSWLAVSGRFTVGHLIGLLIVLVVYGAFDEWLQQFVNRYTDFADWVADVIGAMLGILCACVLQFLQRGRRTRVRDFANSRGGDYDGRKTGVPKTVEAAPFADDVTSSDKQRESSRHDA